MFCVTYTLSLSVCWWTLRFFPISWPLYYRLRFSEPWGAYIFSSYFFLSSDKYPEVKLLDPRVVLFFEETSYCFPPTVFKGSFFSILSLTFFLSYVLILAILTSVRGYLITVLVYIFPMLVIRASFHLSLCHLYVVFGKRCIQILCPVFNWTFFFFLLLSCMSSLCILDIDLLSNLWFSDIFSHFVGCLFVLLRVSFAAQKPFSLM